MMKEEGYMIRQGWIVMIRDKQEKLEQEVLVSIHLVQLFGVVDQIAMDQHQQSQTSKISLMSLKVSSLWEIKAKALQVQQDL